MEVCPLVRELRAHMPCGAAKKYIYRERASPSQRERLRGEVLETASVDSLHKMVTEEAGKWRCAGRVNLVKRRLFLRWEK